MPSYARSDLAFVRGEGAWLYAEDGRRFLDFAAGVAVNSLGHCHPRLVEALRHQAENLWHTSNLYRVPGQERVAARLVEATFADTVFFCNSGAEAMECAIKTARKFHAHAGRPERNRIIVCRDAFHGRTMATITAGGQPKHTQGFEPLLDGFDRVPFGNLNELKNAIGPATAAIMVEPVQGEGGIHVAPAGYLEGLRRAADEYGLLLIFDEVQCGMGRTGRLLAHEWSGVAPDIAGLAKGLGGGFPVGACLATERAAAGMTAGTHGSTFGGNPLAMAAAEAVLDVMLDDGFMPRVERAAARLRSGLDALAARHPEVIHEVRGKGLMLGLKCAVPNTGLVAGLQNLGLLTVGAADNVVRLLPPLTVEDSEIDMALDHLERACSEMAR